MDQQLQSVDQQPQSVDQQQLVVGEQQLAMDQQQLANLYAAMLPYYGYDYGYYPYPYMYGYDPYATAYESELEATTDAPSGDETASTEPEMAEISKGAALQAIRSVSDIHRVYDNEEDTTTETETEDEVKRSEEEEDIKVEPVITQPTKGDSEESSSSSSSEDSDEFSEDNDDEDNIQGSDDHVPHQLSVIFEESDAGVLSDVTERRREASVASEDDSSTTIALESGDEEETVTVRLPLRFKFSRTENDEDVTTVIVGDSQMDRCNSVSVTVSIPSPSSRSATSIDKSHEDDTSDDDSSSSSSSEEDEDEDDVVSVCNKNPPVSLPLPEKMPLADKPLSEILPTKEATNETEEIVTVSVRDRIMAIEKCQAPEKVEKSTENTDDEEADSGVTSQTDTESECFLEIRRNNYQRAATHSRLFKLLNDQCQDSDEEDDDNETQFDECDSNCLSREQLSLPLAACSRSSVPDSFSSSGIASPASTPPRRGIRSAVQSELSTPGDTWPDYGSYYSSWDERSRGGCGSPFLSARSSPFPLAPPRCPMTPVCAGQAMAAQGGTSTYIGGGVS